MTEKIKRRGVRAPDAYEPDVLQGIPVMQLLLPVASSAMPAAPYVYASDDVGLAAEMMGRHDTDKLQVREDKESCKVIGVVTAASILAYYSRQKQKEHIYHSPGRTRRMLLQGRNLLLRGRNLEKHM